MWAALRKSSNATSQGPPGVWTLAAASSRRSMERQGSSSCCSPVRAGCLPMCVVDLEAYDRPELGVHESDACDLAEVGVKGRSKSPALFKDRDDESARRLFAASGCAVADCASRADACGKDNDSPATVGE
eukprot:CAMPEP_0179182474 /NCGR_PEP_ID=MMETSP0796-20121207/90415_1 /TAXON_ID=73915 /ORGANISM="Pyrodinium bahamense, Strain pbaha01" /LENGTH=129 /DNA_ID=CAMNT_0020886319 /DNA_START=188 /DNA_END=574 /DNA_ORIENTATION=-